MATAASIVFDLLMRTGSFETDTARAEKRIKSLKKEADKLNQVKVGDLHNVLGARSLDGLAKFGKLGASLFVFGTAVKDFAELTDQGVKLTGILKNVSDETINFNQAFSDVKSISSASQAELQGIGVVYARIANALKEFGVAQEDVASITETLSLALKVNGATSAETTSTLIQLSQAFGKGKLDGDEFRTAMEAAPNVMRELAKSMGVPFGALKDLAAEGKITSEVLLKAFTNQEYLNSLRSQAKEMITINGSLTELKNSLVSAVIEFNEGTGAGKLFAQVIRDIANDITNLVNLLSGEPLDFSRLIPGGGKSIRFDETSGKIYVDTLENINKELEKNRQLQSTNEVGKSNILPRSAKIGDVPKDSKDVLILGRDNSLSQYQKELEKQQERITKFLNNSKFQTAKEKTENELGELKTAFDDATKGLSESAPAYIDALKNFKDKEAEILNKDKKKKQGKTDLEKELEQAERFVENLQKQTAVLGFTNSELILYEASQLKLSETQKLVVRGLIEQNEAFERNKQAIEDWQEQDKLNQNFDMSELETLEQDSAAAATAIENFKKKSYDAFVELQPKAEQLAIAIEEVRSEAEALGLGEEYSQPIIDALILADEQANKTSDEFKRLERAIDGFAKKGAESVADFAFGAETSFSEMVNSFLKDLARLALQNAIFDPLAEKLTSVFSTSASEGGPISSFLSLFSGEAFAGGGRPKVGKASLVGELGPELFIPDSSGTVIPNDMLGGGGSIQVNVAVDASGSSVQGSDQKGNDLGKALAASIKTVLLQEKRPGGLLA